MKSLIACLLVTSISAPAVAAEIPRQEMLKRIYEMRMQFEREQRQAENEARSNAGLIRAETIDAPTVSQMRREMGASLAQISNHYRCLDVEVENEGGNTVVVCGNNNGYIGGENTTAGGNVIGSVNQEQGAYGNATGGSRAGGGGTMLVGPLGNPVNNSGTYVETSVNNASNSVLVKGDVNAPLVQTNTQANGDIGDRTVVVDN